MFILPVNNFVHLHTKLYQYIKVSPTVTLPHILWFPPLNEREREIYMYTDKTMGANWFNT